MPLSFRVGILCGGMGCWVIKKAFRECFGADRMDLDVIIPKANVAPTEQITGVGMAAGRRGLTYVVTLDGGAPKLVPWFAEWEANLEAHERAEEARQKATFEEKPEQGRKPVEILLLRVETWFRDHGRDVVKAWDKDLARRWWAEVVSVTLSQDAALFELCWELKETRRRLGSGRV